MAFCKYHPLKAAGFYCPHCDHYTCETCVNDSDGDRLQDEHCFTCGEIMESQGAAYKAPPFWRRLNEAFRYPLSGNAMVAIVVAVVLGLAGMFLPWLLLLSSAIMTKYCFCCLEHTARGKMVAAEVTEAYQGGIVLLFKLLVILVAAIGGVVGAGYLLGPTAAIAAGCFVAVALPASFMILAIEHEVLQAINPLKLLRLMLTIGPAYLLLLALLFVMLGSVEVLSYMVGDRFVMTGMVAQMIISNYYSVVMFHLMGYVIFQYQDKLGFEADEVIEESDAQRTPQEMLQAEVDVLVKEGEYEQAMEKLHGWLQANPNDAVVADAFFKLIIALKAKQPLAMYADKYFQSLISRHQDFKINSNYKLVLAVLPDYRPGLAQVRLKLAGLLSERGDFRHAAKMLKDFHKDFQDDQQVIRAYTLMAEILEHLPNTEVQQKQYRQFVDKRKAKEIVQKTVEEKPAKPALDDGVIEFC